MIHEDSHDLRQAIIDGCRWMNASGLNQGTSGNISVRCGDDMLITPSGVPYADLKPEMICKLALGVEPDLTGTYPPSSEWRFHQTILNENPDQSTVVHAHPAHATALAVQRKPIPACHYMVAAFGGNDVPGGGLRAIWQRRIGGHGSAGIERPQGLPVGQSRRHRDRRNLGARAVAHGRAGKSGPRLSACSNGRRANAFD